MSTVFSFQGLTSVYSFCYTESMRETKQTNYRLTIETINKQDELSNVLGLTRTGVVSMLTHVAHRIMKQHELTLAEGFKEAVVSELDKTGESKNE